MGDELLKEVEKGLKKRKGDWLRIASDIPNVSYSWISKVGRGKYRSAPSYKRLQAVAQYLRRAA